MTSKLQLMDQGVLKNIKRHYQEKIMRRHLRKLDSNEHINDVNLLDCIHILQSSWETATKSTIANCFREAGFHRPTQSKESEKDEEEEQQSDIPVEWLEYKKNTRM